MYEIVIYEKVCIEGHMRDTYIIPTQIDWYQRTNF